MELQEMLSQPGPILVDTSFFNNSRGKGGVVPKLRKAKRLRDVPEQELKQEIKFVSDFYKLLMQEKLCPPGVEQNNRFFTIPEVVLEIGGYIRILNRVESTIFSNLGKMNNRSRVYLDEMQNHLGGISLVSQYKKSILELAKIFSQRNLLSCFDSDDLDAFKMYDSWLEQKTSEWNRSDGSPEISGTDRRLIAAGLVSAQEGDTMIITHDSGIGRLVKSISIYRERTGGKRMPLPANNLAVYSNFGNGWYLRADCHKGYHPCPSVNQQRIAV